MTVKLKPCPFCGSKARRQGKRSYKGKRIETQYRVICSNLKCRIFPVTHWRDTAQEAYDDWNRRIDNDR